MDTPDEQIAGAVQHGDTDAFGTLVDRYEQKMTRYARRFLSDRDDIADLVQNVFLKAYENIQSYDVTRRFSPWLYRIAHNTFVDALAARQRSILRFIDFDTFFPHPEAPERTDRDLELQQLRTQLNTCLDAIGAKYREPLILYYFEDMSYEDIAEVLHIPVATVGVRLHRGRDLLRARCTHL